MTHQILQEAVWQLVEESEGLHWTEIVEMLNFVQEADTEELLEFLYETVPAFKKAARYNIMRQHQLLNKQHYPSSYDVSDKTPTNLPYLKDINLRKDNIRRNMKIYRANPYVKSIHNKYKDENIKNRKSGDLAKDLSYIKKK